MTPSPVKPRDVRESFITLYELSLELESLLEEQAGEEDTITIPARLARKLVPLITLTAGYALARAEHGKTAKHGGHKDRK